MDLKILKQLLEKGEAPNSFFIFRYEDNDFLPKQYINNIKKSLKLEVQYIDSINEVLQGSNDIFGTLTDSGLRVYETDFFDADIYGLKNEQNLIVVCKKISKECQTMFKENVVIFPKLEMWQIKDYVYSLAEGVDRKKLNHLIDICKNDIYRIDKELSKLKLFTEQERKYIYDKFVEDGVFDDLSEHNIFDFTNAIIKKDIPSLASLYKELEKIDVEPLGLVTILYNNLKSIIMIQLNPTATAESLGIASNRFWAIKKNNCGFYDKEQLLHAYEVVTSIDRKLKTGEITSDLIIDYIVCQMLSF